MADAEESAAKYVMLFQIGATLGAIGIFLTIVFGTGFFVLYKRSKILRARSRLLVGALFITNILQIIKLIYYLSLGEAGVSDTDCILDNWVGGILQPLFITAILTRCIRLLAIFNLAKYTMRDIDEVDEGEQVVKKFSWKRKTFWQNPKLVSEKYMFSLYIGMWLVTQILPTLTTIMNYTSGTEQCFVFRRVARISVVCALLIALGAVAIKLRHVHDAYFLKKEFELIAIFVSPFGLGGFIVGIPAKSADFAHLVSMCMFIASAIIMFVIPVCLAIREPQVWKWVSRDSTKGSSTNSTVSDIESLSADSKDSDDKKGNLLEDKDANRFMQDYILHYQVIRMSNLLLLYEELRKYATINKEVPRISKAWLLYQKFLQPNAYIEIDEEVLSDQDREYFKEVISAAMDKQTEDKVSEETEEKAAKVTRTLFEDLEQKVIKILELDLVAPFKESEYYAKYIEYIRLSKGIATTIETP